MMNKKALCSLLFFALGIFRVDAADIVENTERVLVEIETIRSRCSEELKALKMQNSALKKTLKEKENIIENLENKIYSLKKDDIQKEKLLFFKPSAFRLKNDANIYDSFENPKKIALWEAGRSFTSNQGTEHWIKITGYFHNRLWQAAKEPLWIHKSDVIKRDNK